MAEAGWKDIAKEFHKAKIEQGHPYRTFTLGTIGLEQMPRQRLVVLRDVLPDLTLRFYTDRRSKKVMHIKENNRVSALFYHPEKLIQLKFEGAARILADTGELERMWKTVPESNRKDYTASSAPGSLVGGPEEITYLNGAHHFCIVDLIPFKIEYLKLGNPRHTKIRYSRTEDARSRIPNWKSEFLVP